MDIIYERFNPWWVPVLIIGVYAVVLLFTFNKRRAEKWKLIISAAILLVLGTIVHWKPYNFAKSSYTFFWSVISSAELFITKSSIEAIHISDEIASLTEQEYTSEIGAGYLNAYFTVYVCAILTSAYFILKTFCGRQLKNGKILFGRILNCILHIRRHDNVFFGWNEPTRLLMKDRSSVGENVTVIVSPLEKRKRMKVFDFLKKEEHLYSSEELEAADLLISRIPLSMLKFSSIKECCISMGYRQFHKRMKNADLFFLSDDENFNIRMALSFAKLDTSGKIYCHCRKESIKKYYSDAYGTYDIVFVDSAELAIRSLKMGDNGKFPYHPVNYVDIAEDENGRRLGYVQSPFNALLLGFGQTGQEAMSFLYEFGAFPQKNKERGEFHCLAYDMRMGEIEGHYLATHPALDVNLVSLQCADINSSDFWNELVRERTSLLKKPFIRLVNYVVVSLGDDQFNVSVGIDLLKKVYEYRKGDLRNFIILVHTISSSPEIENTVQYYKRIYGDHIALFGSNESIWKMSIINNLDLTEKAASYYDSYLRAQGEQVAEFDCSDTQQAVSSLSESISKEFHPKAVGAGIDNLLFSILANAPGQDDIEQNADYLVSVKALSGSISSVAHLNITEDSLYEFLLSLLRQEKMDKKDVEKERTNHLNRISTIIDIASRINDTNSVIPFLYLLAFYQSKYVKGFDYYLHGEKKTVSGYHLRILRKEMLKTFFWNKISRGADGNKFYKDAIKEIYKIERQDSQDVSNALHCNTKMHLSDALSLRDESEKIECSYWTWKSKQQGKNLAGKEMEHYFGNDDYANRTFEYLAICEHLRWAAAHQMMGYRLSDNGKTDDLLRIHNSMIPYDRLNTLDGEDIGTYKHYDWVVVKTSFQISDRLAKLRSLF